MSKTTTVREYGHLFAASENPPSIDPKGQISNAAFKWLRKIALSESEKSSPFLILTARDGVECLKVKNFVGVISTPDGTVIEILPKHTSEETEAKESRELLWKMLRVVHDINWSSSTEAALKTWNKPLPDLLISWFLSKVNYLVHRGIRSDYQRVRETRKFLKGRWDISRQLRLPPGKATDFCVDFDAYTVNRPENRLIKCALEQISRWPLSLANTRLAKELSVAFANVDGSQNIAEDFTLWRKQRDMAHYQPVKPWLELILNNQSPWSLLGNWQGISMLFPMEKLFEKYLERILRKQITSGYKLKGQAASEYLAWHKGWGMVEDKEMFQLKPDLLIKKGGSNYSIMDAKWKLLDQKDREKKYELQQSDFYQLFAYGHKYLKGKGDMLLIYPKHADFTSPLDVFRLNGSNDNNANDGLNLWVAPFDLEDDILILPEELDLGCFPKESVAKTVLRQSVS